MTVGEKAYAKVNLVLRVGPRRSDGLHPLSSLMVSVALADDLSVEPAEAGADTVVCPGITGENLAARAAAVFRTVVPELPPLRITVEKRIPVAAGLGGGSADAAAVLRAANRLTDAGLDPEDLRRLAAELGSDVPSQVEPRHSIVSGVGEHVEPLLLPAMSLVLVPRREGLSTADVFEELDRLRAESRASPREADSLAPGRLRRLAGAPLAELAARLENDLQPAAVSLRPELERPLASLLRSGALAAQVTGSGPTTYGLFTDRAAAAAAARGIGGAILTEARSC